MQPDTIGIISLIVLFIVLMSGLPVAFSLALVGFLGFLVSGGLQPALGLLSTIPYTSIAGFGLVVVPMFILMGEIIAQGEIHTRTYATARQWFGRLPGGLAMAAVATCAAFGAACGSTIAATATIGRMSIGEMIRYGYKERLATGVVAMAGNLACLIPPSIGMVIYGLITGQSIGRLLMAGIVPGVISSLIFMALIYVMVKRNPSLAPTIEYRVSWTEKVKSLRSLGPILMIAFIVMGGIYSGLITVVEASAFGALGAVLIVSVQRKLTRRGLSTALLATGRLTCMILLILVGGAMYSRFLTFSGLPFAAAHFFAGLEIPRMWIMVIIMVMYAFLGCFLDPTGMMMVTLPFIFPIVTSLGFDPI